MPSWAQEGGRALSQYVHRSWSTEDGLPHDAVRAIAQTRDGYLWVGTRGGLARFDGARFTVFSTATTALPSNEIRALHPDASGALWIGTTGGLVRYRKGRFSTFTTADGLPDNRVRALLEDPSAPGTLWVGTLDGLARYRDGRITTFTTADGLLADDVRALAAGADGTLWVGSYGGGVSHWNGTRFTSYPLSGVSTDPWIYALLQARDGRVWVGLGQGQADASPYQLLELAGDRYRPLAPPVDLSSIRALHEDRQGSLWIGTYGGGLAYRQGDRMQTYGPDDGLSDDRVNAIHEDREGNLWIGTMRGLNLLRQQAAFTPYGAEEGLPDANVRAVTQDASGAVWIGTAGGAARLDAGGLTPFTVHEGLAEAFVHSVYADHAGGVWLGGERTVTRTAGGAVTTYPLPEGIGSVRSIVEDANGQLWLGCFGGGLVRFSPAGSRTYTEANGLPSDNVSVLLADSLGRVWVGTEGGLAVMERGRLARIQPAVGTLDTHVRSLYLDRGGVLWIGTVGQGLIRYHEGQAAAVTMREGLHDDGIWSILEDDRGWLWMSSDRGVFRVAKAEVEAVAAGRQARVTPVAYGVADGMRTIEANGASKPSAWRSRDGRMWFATQRGVVVVDPVRVARPAPTPRIEGVRTQAGGVLALPEGRLHLKPEERDFEVRFTALSLAQVGNLRFRYRLDGYDQGWHEGDDRRAAYTNIPPGHYTFRLQAAQQGEAWSAEEAVLTLAVAPFAWETWWYRGLGLLGLAGMVAAAMRWRTRQARRREAVLEQQVVDRTKALALEHRRTEAALLDAEAARADAEAAASTIEAQRQQLATLDEAKTRFFTNVSHEFRTPLTLTIGPLEDLDGAADLPDAARQSVGLALRYSRRLLRLTDQLLDVAKIESGSMKLNRRLFDLGPFVEALALGFMPLAERRRVDFSHRPAAAPVVVSADPEAVEQIVVNLLSNAFKFTPEGGAVTLALVAEGGSARLVVDDTGPGIPPDALPHLFERFYQVDESGSDVQAGTGIGLALTRDLAELHGGAVHVESTPGLGSRFVVTLPRADLASADPAAPRPAPRHAESRLDADDPAQSPQPDDGDDDRTTVLVVDDNADVRRYVRAHLEATYRVLEAADGQEGVRLARERLPDCVVSDVMMPRLDGFGLVRALRADPATDFLPIVLLTAKATEKDKLGGLGEGADDYLVKPFSVHELRVRIHNLIRQRQRLRHRFGEGAAGGDGAAREPTAPVEPPREADAAFLRQARAVVEANLSDEGFTIDALADAMAQSRRTLHRRLKAVADTTPQAFIQDARLARAAELLSERAGTVSEVAYGVGFKSVSHFSRAFRARFGVPPSDWAPRTQDAPA